MSIYKTRIYVLFLLLIIPLITSTDSLAVRPPKDNQLPDALILIVAKNPGAHLVSLTYPKVIKRSQAESDLARLLKETGWTATNISITDESIMKLGENPMTSIEFMTPEAVNVNSGYLPIEPIIKALRNLKNVSILYMVPTGFQFSGVGNYENKYVNIALSHGIDSYQYTINIKNPNFESLHLPAPSRQGQSADHGGARLHPIAIVLITLLALMAAFLVYMLTARLVGKTR